MKKVISWTAFQKMLENNHFDNLTYETQQMIFDIFKYREFSTDEVYSIINGARKKLILSSTDKKFVKLNLYKLIREYFSNSEIELYKRLDEIDQIFKDYFKQNNLKQKDYTEGLKDCWALARRVNKTVNSELIQFTEEELKTFEILAKIYRSVAEHVENEPITAKVRYKDENDEFVKDDKSNKYKMTSKEFIRVADYIVSTRLAELKDSTLSNITLETANEFDKFLKSITSIAEDNAKDTFSKEEVKILLDKSISLITKVSADKYEAIRDSLNVYLETIIDKHATKSNETELQEFSNLTAKNIILRCASILVQSPESIGFSLDFVMGKSMKEAGNNMENSKVSATSKTGKYAKLLVQQFPNLRLTEMDMQGHLYFAKQSPSHMLVLTTSSIYNKTTSLMDTILNGLNEDIKDLTVLQKKSKLKEKGFDVDSMYTKDNLFEVFSNSFNETDSTQQKNISENVRILSKYLLPGQLKKIFSHNFNLLLVDNQKILEKLDEIQNLSQGDNKKFIKLFHDFVNAKYSIVESTNAISQPKVRSKKSSIETEDKMDLPDKKIIIVSIIGKEIEVDEKKVSSVEIEAEKTFGEIYGLLCDELSSISRFAKCKSKNELEKEQKHFAPRSVADLLSTVHSNSRTVPKNMFEKAIATVDGYFEGVKNAAELRSKDKRYVLELIEKSHFALSERREALLEELKETDDLISTITHEEKDKNSRKKSQELNTLIKKIQELQSNNLIVKKYHKLIDENTMDQLFEDQDKAQKENERIKEYREMLPQLLSDTSVLKRELEYISTLCDTLQTYKSNLETVEEQVENPTDEAEIRKQLENLYEQRELKVRSIRIAYNSRIRNNDFDSDDLEKIVSGNPHGERMLAIVKKIDSQIKELESKLTEITIV